MIRVNVEHGPRISPISRSIIVNPVREWCTSTAILGVPPESDDDHSKCITVPDTHQITWFMLSMHRYPQKAGNCRNGTNAIGVSVQFWKSRFDSTRVSICLQSFTLYPVASCTACRSWSRHSLDCDLTLYIWSRSMPFPSSLTSKWDWAPGSPWRCASHASYHSGSENVDKDLSTRMRR